MDRGARRLDVAAQSAAIQTSCTTGRKNHADDFAEGEGGGPQGRERSEGTRTFLPKAKASTDASGVEEGTPVHSRPSEHSLTFHSHHLLGAPPALARHTFILLESPITRAASELNQATREAAQKPAGKAHSPHQNHRASPPSGSRAYSRDSTAADARLRPGPDRRSCVHRRR